MRSEIDTTLAALANPMRRAMVDRLLQGNASVNELAHPHGVTLGAISQHLKVLEGAGLITRRLEGRTHQCELHEPGMAALLAWTQPHQQFWDERLDALKQFVETPTGAPSMIQARVEEGNMVRVERFIDASPEFLFRCFTETKLLEQWSASRGDADVRADIDPREGGHFHITFATRDGGLRTTTGRYLTVEAPVHLSFTWKWGEHDATTEVTQVDVSFERQARGTRLVLLHGRFENAETAQVHLDGWQASTACIQEIAEVTP